jgi:hypothetical protein
MVQDTASQDVTVQDTASQYVTVQDTASASPLTYTFGVSMIVWGS